MKRLNNSMVIAKPNKDREIQIERPVLKQATRYLANDVNQIRGYLKRQGNGGSCFGYLSKMKVIKKSIV